MSNCRAILRFRRRRDDGSFLDSVSRAGRPALGCSLAEANWYVCQIGAREHYSIARALHERSQLKALVTDAWSQPGSLTRKMSGRLGQRYHDALKEAPVRAASFKSVAHVLTDRISGRSGWASIMKRNDWFSKWAADQITRNERVSKSTAPVVFAYSYAARHVFRELKKDGFRTILGQIDPGPVEARLVAELYAAGGQPEMLEPIPDQYWELWREEVELADTIVVNSKWSASGLIDEGVPPEKIKIVPLALGHNTPTGAGHKRPVISKEAPLKLLFLGQVTLRKGIHLVFEAARLLPNAPIHIDIVGDVQVAVPEWVASDERIHFYGRVSREDVWSYYQNADAFLFPTYSDGFGLTQLEAIAAGVPVICSNRCGDVVQHEINGHVLEDLSAACLASVIETLLKDSDKLLDWKSNCKREPRFEIAALAETLQKI